MRKLSRMSTKVMIAVVGCLEVSASAQQQGGSFAGPQMQYATIVGSGNTITATQVPVVTDTGVVYQDLILQFDNDAYGGLTMTSGFPVSAPSPQLQTASFQQGNYKTASTVLGGKGLIAVSGPGVTVGGATAWSLSTRDGADGCTYPRTVVWYVGPIESSPIAARLKKAGITSKFWSYGITGGGGCLYQDAWGGNNIVGLSQIGNTLTIATFSGNGSANADHPEPIDQLTFTLTK